jgi:hypothetical protein
VTRNDEPNRFDFEWVAISKRALYLGAAGLLLVLLTAGAGVYFWLYGNPFARDDVTKTLTTGARFDTIEGDVRVIRAETRELIQARADTRLFPGDTLQTQEDGRARISLADGAILAVRPNSIITINNNESTADGQRTNVFVAVDRGHVNLRTDRQTPAMSNVLETPLTKNRMAAESAVSFGVNDDRSEDIRVSSGSVTTRTRGGDDTTIREGEYLALNQTGAVTKREPLLDTPVPYSPRHLELVTPDDEGTADVTLRWAAPPSGRVSDYRVELAASPFFVRAGMVIERGQLVKPELIVTELRTGHYFWRVLAYSQSGQTSEWSEPQKFTVTNASTAPSPRTPRADTAAPPTQKRRGP